MKLPSRGFSNAPFRDSYETVNLFEIEKAYGDDEVVNLDTLKKKGLVPKNCRKVKILGEGNISKKVTFEVQAISAGAREKLQKGNISYTLDA